MLSFTLHSLGVHGDRISLLSTKDKVWKSEKGYGNNPTKGRWKIYIILSSVGSKVPRTKMTLSKFSFNMLPQSAYQLFGEWANEKQKGRLVAWELISAQKLRHWENRLPERPLRWLVEGMLSKLRSSLLALYLTKGKGTTWQMWPQVRQEPSQMTPILGALPVTPRPITHYHKSHPCTLPWNSNAYLVTIGPSYFTVCYWNLKTLNSSGNPSLLRENWSSGLQAN